MRISHIAFDCSDATELARFWAAVMGWDVSPDSTADLAAAGGPNRAPDAPPMLFNRVPEEKIAKNRVHIDLETDDLPAETRRLLGLGARFIHEKLEYETRWTTFADPEGNEFCVVQKAEPEA
jgi:predicted enzyme related to lactoylglutathione lyase